MELRSNRIRIAHESRYLTTLLVLLSLLLTLLAYLSSSDLVTSLV